MTVLSSKILPIPKPEDRDFYFVIQDLLSELNTILNGGILFSDNFSAKMVTFTSSATPDEENTVAHTLGKVPTGYIVYSRDKAAVLYNGTTAWTSTNLYVKCNVASTVMKILVF